MTRKFIVTTTMLLGVGIWALWPTIVHAGEKPAARTPVTEKQALAFATALVTAIDSGQGAVELVDWGTLMVRTSQGLDVAPKVLADFQKSKEEMAVAPTGFFGLIRGELEKGGAYKYMRVFQEPQGTRARFRFLPAGGGVDFHDFLLREEKGRIRAVDFKFASTGEEYSQSLRRTFLPLAVKANPALRDRLAAKDSAFLKHLTSIEAITKSLQEGHPERVAPIASQLPADLRNEKFCLLLELKSSQLVSDDKAVQEVIDRYHRLYPNDVAIELFSMDYFVKKDSIPKALVCAERFQKGVGQEAFMQSLIADLQWQDGQLKEALASINKAIRIEPEYVDAYWTLVTIADSEKDFAAVNKTLQKLVKEFGAELDPETMRTEPFYAEFVKSPEFAEFAKFLDAQGKKAEK